MTWRSSRGRAVRGPIGALFVRRPLSLVAPHPLPGDGGGVLQDPERSFPLLKDGLPEEALLPLGRPL
ncbi:hypothetical protein ABT116_35705 [Streptomyces sp. NPDC002130]|uniref:hypothetical protein n=1 Tax=Streptomyces sp. NPDC002130 TaxID=3155568 RepID=UPI0033243493